MRSIILGFIVMIFIGCGSSSTKKDPIALSLSTDAPASPVTKEKGKIPPSIPSI
jgi:hypothetical protein